jgi:hypothetical protein
MRLLPLLLLILLPKNQVFTPGQTITIKGNVSDNEGIHMVHVIVSDNTGGHWVHSEDHPDSKSFAINKTFVASPGKTYTIHIDASDHNENTITSELTVSAN